uniref:NADH-ubiquinone oxidoreductase chain 3 n=1 Tax=Paramblynotus sp. ZJUH 20220012 TaxID=2943458 RepID=A0A9E8GDZ5_9HYME|nr:NADH dehydrogenase subunit 3 [Paramblynotus sp. ZJUH 20220012]
MLLLMILNLIMIILSMIILFMNFFLSKKYYKSRNKLTSFECGFDNISMLRLPFSVQFYLISIIFLIFDIEIALIFPVIKIFSMLLIFYMNMFLYILIILIIGLYYEWKEGSLKWLN